MARKAQITRTIISTKVTVLTVDCETAELGNETIIIPGKADEKTALKFSKNELETDNIKVVKVVKIDTDQKLYAMDEATFIAHADVIGEGRIGINK